MFAQELLISIDTQLRTVYELISKKEKVSLNYEV